ncbi:SPASM domain-containing protein, partial [Geomonas sp.]|uniref:SPASM domain-containing protein n=1 Tax=Geomonas sp. TaxID=2651584 RepID=UPI002B47DF09
TPMMGDALLDPHLLERLRLLAAHPEIRQITMTTNAIALEEYSDDEVRLLLKTLFCLQVSIGGLDAETYRRMYGVDRFAQVMKSLERLERLRGELPQGAQLTFAFRTNDSKFEARFKNELAGFRSRGIFVSHMSIFANYAGGVSEVNHGELSFARNQSRKKTTCISPRLSVAVCWDGRITACGCADFEGDKLPLGRADRDDLAAVWSGEKRKAILRSFEKGKVYPICRNCSAYTPDTFFAEHCFDGIEPPKPLPVDFFHNMMT